MPSSVDTYRFIVGAAAEKCSVAARRFIVLLACSRFGLAEQELVDLLSLDDISVRVLLDGRKDVRVGLSVAATLLTPQDLKVYRFPLMLMFSMAHYLSPLFEQIVR